MALISIQNARPLIRTLTDEQQGDDGDTFSADYLGWARDDVDALRAGYAELERALAWSDNGAAGGIRQAILATAQAISEQAATFGFTLIAEIADSLCAAMDGEETRLSALEAHLLALEKAIALGLKGDGGAVGADLITRLPH